MMNKDDLKDKIISYNKAYRSGTALISDVEFDNLLEEFEKLCATKEEFSDFQNSLHEQPGKVKHPYIMGSLNKLKAEEPKTVIDFLGSIASKLNVSAKVDGLSCRLHYEGGKIVSASSRGDGSFGESFTDKIFTVKNIPVAISITDEFDVRGELVICSKDFVEFETTFANPRNAVAGLMNRKDWNKADISKISFIAYTILGNKYAKSEQFKILKENGFVTAWNCEYDKAWYEAKDVVEKLVKIAEQKFDYEHDGLVLSDSNYINENRYRPNNQVAFKLNQQIAETTIIDVAFDGPSKNGAHVPVALVSPVELGGALISRCTLHNLDFISKMNLKYGSKVKLMRSGDVIPKIVELIENPEGSTDIDLPAICNCCGEPLIRDGVNLFCKNKDCKDQVLHQLTSFIVKLGVKGASDKTLENLNILNFDDLLAFRPNSAYKTQIKLYDELLTKVFTRSKQELLAAINIRDVGETLINKIVDFYGLDNIIAGNYVGLPSGIGEITLQKFKDTILENLNIVNKFMKDGRYNSTSAIQNMSRTKQNGMSVCFTGKLNSIGRTEAENKAKAYGFEIKGVSKNLTYLITNDPNTSSGKGKKARELGIKIISEKEFLRMISSNETDLTDL